MCSAVFVTPIDDVNMKAHKCGKTHDPSKTIHECEDQSCAYQWVSEEWINPNG